jgi:hypothetical protein
MSALTLFLRTAPGLAAWTGTLAVSALLAAAPARADGAGFGYWTGDEGDGDHFQYALLEPGSRSHMAIRGDETWGEIGRLEKEVESTQRAVLWFALGERSYVVRDAAAVKRAQEIVAPVARLGAQQGELGRQQGELGRHQGELGRQQGELGAFQGRLGALQARFSALRLTRDEASADELAEIQGQLDELRAYMVGLGQRQRELGQSQRELGQRQRELGERQRVLGDRQREASRMAWAQLRTLAESSVRSGTAEELTAP